MQSKKLSSQDGDSPTKANNSPKASKAAKSSLWHLALGSVVLGILACVSVLVANGLVSQSLVASDHDDGETDTKARNMNITDLYAFREVDQNPNASANDLILVLNTNPRSVARQQYFFSPNARYEFRISRVANNENVATGQTDIGLRFEFTPPDSNNQQRIRITATRDGQTFVAENAVTTPLTQSKIENQVSLGGSNLAVFAGLREDPFFFDVEQYFRVRAGAVGFGPSVGFRPPGTALDFAKGYNVNTIVVRVPVDFLRGSTNASTFDIWTRIFMRDGSGNFVAVERIGTPGINEALLFDSELNRILNTVGPAFEAAVLAGREPQASAAAPIIAQAKQTLKAFGNSEERANFLLQALLPDVMRIDTLRPSGFVKAANSRGTPITGRLLKDDVIDATLQLVTANPSATDNVSYEGAPGNPAQGHQPLATSFPYLARPN